MADFAKALLMKYGWEEGKGLGKDESGIVEPLRPKLKFDSSGIGHDSAKEFSCHWWESMFDKAVKNITVNSSTSDISIRANDEEAIAIGAGRFHSKTGHKKKSSRYDNFLKTSTLMEDGQMIPESGFEQPIDLELESSAALKLSDEQLFRACGGRTAHKGARHGLTLNGKLARIAQQEKELLASMTNNLAVDNSEKPSCTHTQVKVGSKSKSKGKRNRIRDDNVTSVESSSVLDGNANNILPGELPLHHDVQVPKKSKKAVKREKREIKDLTEQLDEACNIVESTIEPIPSCSYKTNFTYKTNNNSKRKRKHREKQEDSNSNTVHNGSEWVLSFVDDIPLPPGSEKKLKKEKKHKSNDASIEFSEPKPGCSYANDTVKRKKSKRKRNQDTKNNDSNASELEIGCPTLVSSRDTPLCKKFKKSKDEKAIGSIQSLEIDHKAKESVANEKKCNHTTRPIENGVLLDKKKSFKSTDRYDYLKSIEVNRLNHKISKKKRPRFNRKGMAKKLEFITENLMNVNLKGESREQISDSKSSKKAIKKAKLESLMKDLMAVNLAENNSDVSTKISQSKRKKGKTTREN